MDVMGESERERRVGHRQRRDGEEEVKERIKWKEKGED